MVLKLYGYPLSTCTRRVATVLFEKNVPFELHAIDFLGNEHKSPAYLEKQPFGQVPYLDDDGFILYESRAIARYVEQKYRSQGTKLTPSDPKAQALYEQAVSIEAFNFDPFASKAVAENIFKPLRGQTPDKAVFDGLIESLSTRLDVYDKILSKQKYLAGDELTMADLFHLPYGTLLKQAGSDIMTAKPNVARWWNDISSRPSWIEAGAAKGIPVANAK